MKGFFHGGGAAGGCSLDEARGNPGKGRLSISVLRDNMRQHRKWPFCGALKAGDVFFSRRAYKVSLIELQERMPCETFFSLREATKSLEIVGSPIFL